MVIPGWSPVQGRRTLATSRATMPMGTGEPAPSELQRPTIHAKVRFKELCTQLDSRWKPWKDRTQSRATSRNSQPGGAQQHQSCFRPLPGWPSDSAMRTPADVVQVIVQDFGPRQRTRDATSVLAE